LFFDDELQAVADKPPYQWMYNGTGSHFVYAKAYNDVGLYNERKKNQHSSVHLFK
jgi:hypothetical protein